MSNIFRLAETAGLELEFCNLKAKNLSGTIGRFFTFTHDASVETQGVPNYKGIPIHLSNNLRGKFSSTTIGREIISTQPLEINSSFEIINTLTSWLKEQGVNSKSDRAGIHIHVTCSPNFSILREIFNYGLYLEAPLFYFGSMGYEFRGVKNSCSYSFPLSRPPIIKNNGYNRKLYDEDDIFKAKTYSQITERMGDIARVATRYSPARYAYLNYFSTILRGSLEFRIFNLTLSPFAIDLALRLSGHITKAILKRSYDEPFIRLESNPITNTSKEDSIEIMRNFLIETGFDDIDNVLLIMEKSPEIFVNPNPVYTHLHYHPTRGNICPELYYNDYRPLALKINSSEILKPTTNQSHNTLFERKSFPLKHLLKTPVNKLEFPETLNLNLEQEIDSDDSVYESESLESAVERFTNATNQTISDNSSWSFISTPRVTSNPVRYSMQEKIIFIRDNLDAINQLLGDLRTVEQLALSLTSIQFEHIRRRIEES